MILSTAHLAGPVQAADPPRQKLRRIDVGLGLNVALYVAMDGHRIAAEYIVPVSQHVTGPQHETDAQFVIGMQKAW